jgi:hypothetical protein
LPNNNERCYSNFSATFHEVNTPPNGYGITCPGGLLATSTRPDRRFRTPQKQFFRPPRPDRSLRDRDRFPFYPVSPACTHTHPLGKVKKPHQTQGGTEGGRGIKASMKLPLALIAFPLWMIASLTRCSGSANESLSLSTTMALPYLTPQHT